MNKEPTLKEALDEIRNIESLELLGLTNTEQAIDQASVNLETVLRRIVRQTVDERLREHGLIP